MRKEIEYCLEQISQAPREVFLIQMYEYLKRCKRETLSLRSVGLLKNHDHLFQNSSMLEINARLSHVYTGVWEIKGTVKSPETSGIVFNL